MRQADSVYNAPMPIELHSLQNGMGRVRLCCGVTYRSESAA